jgi:glycosyltransferase involved in cell wall biosynthesis
MRILYIWDADYPWDIRVEKICNTLLHKGYEVHIAARNLKIRPIFEKIDNFYIHRLKPWKNQKANYFFSFPAFFSPFWNKFLKKIVKDNEIDLIIVRDLPLAIAGLRIGKHFKKPVIFDMAEDYVSMIKEIWEKKKYNGFNIFVRNPYFARLVERFAIKRFDHIFVVIEEAIQVVLKAGGSFKKVTIVSNTPTLESIKNESDGKLINISNRYSAIYVGGITLGRGIQIVLESLPEITKTIPDFLFVIVGTGYAIDTLKKIVKCTKMDYHVYWVGWADHKDIYKYIRSSKVGIIPHEVSAHTNTTIPNKIFDYMACGIPVIASNAIPMNRIIAEEKCGKVFKNGDNTDLVRVLIELYKNEDCYGENGKRAVLKKYNWEIDSFRCLQAIISLGGRK